MVVGHPHRTQRLGIGLMALVLVACHLSPAKLPEVRDLPWETQRRFVLLGRVVRSLGCLQDYNWQNPDEECRQAVSVGIEKLASTPSPLMKKLPSETFPKLQQFLRQVDEIEELLAEVKDDIEADDHSMDRLRIAGRATHEAGELAANLAERMNIELSLDAPEWGSFEGLNPTTPRVRRPREAKPTPSPSPTIVVAMATPSPTASPSPIAERPPVTEQTDPAAPVASPKPSVPVVLPSALIAPLKDSVKLFDDARHDPGLLLEASARSRLKLEKLAQLLNTWREMPHADQMQAEAVRFGDQIDRLRGRLLRVSTMYAGGARRVIATTADELVYLEPDGLFEKVKEEIQLAERYKPADP